MMPGAPKGNLRSIEGAHERDRSADTGTKERPHFGCPWRDVENPVGELVVHHGRETALKLGGVSA
jgi:hypothetical protein